MHNKFAQLRESRKQNNEPITVVHIPSIYFCPMFHLCRSWCLHTVVCRSVCRIHVLRYNFKIIFIL